MENDKTRYIVESSSSQVARRARTGKDGAWEVYVTKRQAAVFMYLCRRILVENYVPTDKELASGMKYADADSARAATLVLAKMGLVRREMGRPRSTTITDKGKEVYEAWKKAIEARRDPGKRKKLVSS